MGVWNSNPAGRRSVDGGEYEGVVWRSSASFRRDVRKYRQSMGSYTGARRTVYFAKKQTKQKCGELIMTKK